MIHALNAHATSPLRAVIGGTRPRVSDGADAQKPDRRIGRTAALRQSWPHRGESEGDELLM
jgi:hypothetical protein